MDPMSWLRRLRQGNQRNAFARRVREGLLAGGMPGPIVYDQPAFALRLPRRSADRAPGAIFLDNVFEIYQKQEAASRPVELRKIIASLVEGGESVPTDFSAVAEHILPLVRPLSELGLWRLNSELRGSPIVDEFPMRSIAAGMVTLLALDRPHSMMRITEEHLGKWGVTADTAFDLALANLRKLSTKDLLSLSPSVFTSDWGDTYGSSRLLLVDLFRSLPLKGAPIVMVPNRDVLLVTGSEDEAGLRSMAQYGRQVLNDPRPLSATTLRLEGGVWREFIPNPSRPGEAELRELQETRASREYAEQKEALDAIHQKKNVDIFVATHMIRSERDSRRFVDSLATWSKGVDTLLPRAQTVAFVQGDSHPVISAPWETVAAVAGDLLVPTDYWPERFRVRSFPTDEQLERMTTGVSP